MIPGLRGRGRPRHTTPDPPLSIGEGALPRSLELLLHEAGIVIPLLRLQCLASPNNERGLRGWRSRSSRKTFSAAAGIAVHQQCRAQRLPHRKEPILRLVIFEGVLNRYRVLQLRDCRSVVFLRQRNLRTQNILAIFKMSLALLLTGMAKTTSSGVSSSASATILYSASASATLPFPARPCRGRNARTQSSSSSPD